MNGTATNRWPNVLLAASIVPMALLCAFIVWYQFVFRPSGQERWGDAAAIFYFGALAYPVSLLLLFIGCIWLYRRGRERLRTSLSLTVGLLFLSALALVSPFLLLSTVTSS